jgi:uncharacterized membrane protein (UPF0127 family)
MLIQDNLSRKWTTSLLTKVVGQPMNLQIILTKPTMSQRIQAILTRLGALFACAMALTALIFATPSAAQEPQTDLRRTVIQAGMFQIDAQIASNPQQRQIGLMFRKDMPAHEGMLFVFEEPQKQCFWMKNTLLPLSAAFVDDEGAIVNLVDMQPQTSDSHCSDKPVRYVLEMNQGWFAKKKIGKGFLLKSPVFSTK